MISRTYEINGTAQHLYVRLTDRPRGTLLFLHGGPGWSDAPLAERVCGRLWPAFNTVHWDQRGTNRSYFPSLDPSTLTLEQMTEDGLAVTRLLESRFGISRPILVGHSWGSLLAILMAQREPGLFREIVNIGQLVHNDLSEPLSLEYCARRARELGRADLLERLARLDRSFYRIPKTLFEQREILFELGGEFHSPVSPEEFKDWVSGAEAAYRGDWDRLIRTCEFSIGRLWDEVIASDLRGLEKPLALPLSVLHGRFDYVTALAPVEDWLARLETRCSDKLEVFENSAHWPQLEENEKFASFFLDRF